jgi:diadenosine tetraphosphate (Ap4A) HIT family hydrolase
MSDVANCPFCNLSDRVLRSNKHANLLLSNPHKVPGHFLITPKRHVEKPWELTSKELADIFELIFFVEQKILGELGDGVDIRQNYRPFLPQGPVKVDHVHFHVYPRSDNDYLYQVSEQFETDLFVELDQKEAAAVAELLTD